MSQASNKTIILVDDAPSAREALRTIYHEAGLKVIKEFDSAITALSEVNELSPDYISTDIIMPEMDGIEFYWKLDQIGLGARAFFVSALSLEERVVEAYDETIGKDRFLPKPLTVEILKMFLEKMSEPTVSPSEMEKAGGSVESPV